MIGFWASTARTLSKACFAIGDQQGNDAVLGTTAALTPHQEIRDLLDDLDKVLGVEPVTVAEAAVLLRNLAPSWAPYQGLTGVELRTQLAQLGVKVPATGNRWPLDPVTVRAALARRATADLDDDRS